MVSRIRYDEPFSWWGPGWEARPRLELAKLLQNGTIDPGAGAVLWAALARRRSLAVIAGPSGIGKSTLLRALTEFLPPETRRIYVRGCYESFAFLEYPDVVPGQTAILINEISPHLPIYLWGSAVERTLALSNQGFTLLATAHAGSVAEFVGMLAGSPLRLAPRFVAAFDLVVTLECTRDVSSGRRIHGIWALQEVRDGVSVSALDTSIPAAVAVDPAEVSRFHSSSGYPLHELRQRFDLLVNLRDSDTPSPLETDTGESAQPALTLSQRLNGE